MRQNNTDNAVGFQVEANKGSHVYQAGETINHITLYVTGGQAIINPAQVVADSADATVERVEPSTRRKLGPCPYRGLLAYHEKDSEFYFGRSKEIDQLWSSFRQLHGDADTTRLLPIYGPSGSGKSSLARAGLIPKLAQKPLPRKERARVAVMVPGTQPLQALAAILARIATQDAMAVGKTREFAAELALKNPAGELDGLHRIASLLPEVQTVPLVVVVDQFEEVYSLCKDGAARDAFIGNLLYAAAEATQAVSVIVTFRSDFLAETFQHPQLNRLFSEQGFLAPMMDEGALREAIAQPAANAGAPLDEGTIALLIEQTQGREGALPLLQFALTRIWDGMGKGVEPAQTLRAIGGVGGALADSAQRIYDGLGKAEQDIARRFFLGLVQLGEGVQNTRRRVPVSSLVAARDEPEQVRRVMGKFVSPEARLITLSSEGGVELAEVSHEALIQHWGLLRGWIERNRDLLSQQRRIEASALAWQEQGEVSGYLLQGLPLKEAIQFQKQQSKVFPLSEPTRNFVNTSVNHRHWKRLKTASWLIIPALLLIVMTEHRLRENAVQANRKELAQEGTYAETYAVKALVEGCRKAQKYKLPWYLRERIFGNCRSLGDAPLRKASLSYVDLSYVYLSFADLHSANLRSAFLDFTSLRFADLSSANLSDADLNSADLSYANLHNADLSSANLISASLDFASLQNADLSLADLSNASLHNVDLSKVNLSHTSLISASLDSADLSYSSLASADLSYSSLRRASLENAIALNTNFRKANNLTQEQLEGENSPLLCNSLFPENIPIDRDRDCKRIAVVLLERYSEEFESLEDAQRYVEFQRQLEIWDN